MNYHDDERPKTFMGMAITAKKVFSIAIMCIITIVTLICLPQIFDTVNKGTYQVKQAAWTGTMSAKMTPGIWVQGFGSIDTWPKAETFFFTHNSIFTY